MALKEKLGKLEFIQKGLKKDLVLEDDFSQIRMVGGADVSYAGGLAYSAVVVLDYGDMQLIGEETSKSKITFPYVPSFLSFREAPPITKSVSRLKRKPNVLLVDGHGIAHPRGIGLASHVGVLLDIPTIGVAKNILVGDHTAPEVVGEVSEIIYNKRQVGFAVKTRKGSKPIFISPGHKVSLESSFLIVKNCLRGHRLPEPLRLAHTLSNQAKNC
ncbi:MAG TPA: endonuclease V [Euryarchaeota archaeon]|nr:endonuclease V [Euryarchaeota archaeon]